MYMMLSSWTRASAADLLQVSNNAFQIIADRTAPIPYRIDDHS